MNKWLFAGSVAGFTGVALGAFGAHLLRDRLEPDLLRVWETAVLYHLIHAPALVGVAWVASRRPGRAATGAGIAFTAGLMLFSGSLYLLALTGVRGLGAITPLGGVAFLTGWTLLAVAAVRMER